MSASITASCQGNPTTFLFLRNLDGRVPCKTSVRAIFSKTHTWGLKICLGRPPHTPLLFWLFGQKTHHFCGECQNTQLIKPSMSVKYEGNPSAAFWDTCQYVPHLNLTTYYYVLCGDSPTFLYRNILKIQSFGGLWETVKDWPWYIGANSLVWSSAFQPCMTLSYNSKYILKKT